MTRDITDFLGRYTVTRRIDDRLAGTGATFEGRAEIAGEGPGAVYREVGTLSIAGKSFEAERRYLWRMDGERIAVAFEDGRPFHSFDPRRGGAAEEHLCGDDLYRGGYDLSDWPAWTLTWTVTGPRKDYTSVTRLVRG